MNNINHTQLLVTVKDNEDNVDNDYVFTLEDHSNSIDVKVVK